MEDDVCARSPLDAGEQNSSSLLRSTSPDDTAKGAGRGGGGRGGVGPIGASSKTESTIRDAPCVLSQAASVTDYVTGSSIWALRGAGVSVRARLPAFLTSECPDKISIIFHLIIHEI